MINLSKTTIAAFISTTVSIAIVYSQYSTPIKDHVRFHIFTYPYDISVIDTISTLKTEGIHGAGLYLGNYHFMAGEFIGRAINVGMTAKIPDTAYVYFPIAGCDRSRLVRVPNGPYECNDTTTGQMLEHRVAVPLKSRLPPLELSQKYHMIFTLFPHDSVHLQVETRNLDDCRHIYDLPGIPGIPAVAIVGPCDCCTK